MPIPSTADHKRVDSMERGVLSRLRVAYEALHEASVLVDQNKNVLSRYGSAMLLVDSYMHTERFRFPKITRATRRWKLT